TARIEGAVQVSVLKTSGKCAKRHRSGGDSEADKTALGKEERAHRRVRPKLELRPELKVRGPQIRAEEGGITVDVGHSLRITLREIVGAFCLQGDVGMDI